MERDHKASRRWGFPRFDKMLVREPSVCMVGQTTRCAVAGAWLPKLGRIKLSGGTLPAGGRVLGSRGWREGHRWMLSAQLECPISEPMSASNRTVAINLGERSPANNFRWRNI